MISAQTLRVCREGKPLHTFPDHALTARNNATRDRIMSDAFERFRFSFFEDQNSARDGLDLSSLAQLSDDERVRAEDMLIAYLPDTRAVIGLGVLRARHAEPALTRLFEAERNQPSSGVVYLAKALWRIRPDPRWLSAITDVLASGEFWPERMEAALALLDIRDSATVPALIKALDDDESLVRHHAARALLATHGVPADSDDSGHMIYRVMSKDAAWREGGKRDVLAAIAARPSPEPGPHS
jgi:HEAT repeats